MFKIIDCHLHTEFKSRLFKKSEKLSKVVCSIKGLKKEMRENNIIIGISIGIASKEKELSRNAESPMINETAENIIAAGGINPYKPNLQKVEKAIRERKIKGIKIYLGYYPFYPYDKVYFHFYKLAEKYKIPVIFHTGDTYIENAFVKFAHPLSIDEVAVKFRNVNFILAHFGNPWVMDVAELLWKNSNVYADLSGLIVGDMKNIFGVSTLMLKEALKFADKYDKILYGSDWPLVPMKQYIKFIKKLIPKKYHKKVFYLNAKKLFRL